MLRSIKTLLLWLLLAAIPMQGIAAATMLSCGAIEQRNPAAAGPHVHVHGSEVLVAHDHAGHHDGQHFHGKHDASTSCSACSACCIAAAPFPSGLDWTAVHNSSEAVNILPSPFTTGFIPPGLERPPRALSI